MEDWLRQMWEKGNNPYVRAIGLFIFLIFVMLGVVSLGSGAGLASEIEKNRSIVWAIVLGVAFICSIIWLRLQLLKHHKSMFFHDAQSHKLYLMDMSEKLREIPDEDTFTFLTHALGVPDSTLEIRDEEIARRRGEKLVPVRKWKRPLSPEEKAKEEMKFQVKQALKKTLSRFEENTLPQKIVIGITNQSRDMFLQIENIKFQAHSLSGEALLSTYQKSGTSYIVIPFDKSVANLAPGNNFLVELGLRQMWDPSDIETLKGNLGFLSLDVIYNNRLVEGLLIQI